MNDNCAYHNRIINRESILNFSKEILSVLGLKQNLYSDTLCFDVKAEKKPVLNKRTVLSTLSKIFDP